MKSLPYFLMLIKKNAILWTVISTSSFTNVNLKNTNHVFLNTNYLVLKNYSLNQHDTFNEVWVKSDELSTEITFFTTSPKYLTRSKFYFGKNTPAEYQSPYAIDGVQAKNISKDLGKLNIGFERPAHIIISRSNFYGYKIVMYIYSKDFHQQFQKMIDSAGKVDTVDKN